MGKKDPPPQPATDPTKWCPVPCDKCGGPCRGAKGHSGSGHRCFTCD